MQTMHQYLNAKLNIQNHTCPLSHKIRFFFTLVENYVAKMFPQQFFSRRGAEGSQCSHFHYHNKTAKCAEARSLRSALHICSGHV